MQLDLLGIRITHFSNFLAFFNRLIFSYQQGLIVCIGRQIGIAVFDNDQIPISSQPCAGVNDFSISCSENRVAIFP